MLKSVCGNYFIKVKFKHFMSHITYLYEVTLLKQLFIYALNKCRSFCNKCTDNVQVCCDWWYVKYLYDVCLLFLCL